MSAYPPTADVPGGVAEGPFLLRVVGRLPWRGGSGAGRGSAGVGQASGEETAGGLGSAVRPVRSMGI